MGDPVSACPGHAGPHSQLPPLGEGEEPSRLDPPLRLSPVNSITQGGEGDTAG